MYPVATALPRDVLCEIFQHNSKEGWEAIDGTCKAWADCIQYIAWKDTTQKPGFTDIERIVSFFAEDLDNSTCITQKTALTQILSTPINQPPSLAQILSYNLGEKHCTQHIINILKTVPPDDLVDILRNHSSKTNYYKRETLLFFQRIGLSCTIEKSNGLFRCRIFCKNNRERKLNEIYYFSNSFILISLENNRDLNKSNSADIIDDLINDARISKTISYMQQHGGIAAFANSCIEKQYLSTLYRVICESMSLHQINPWSGIVTKDGLLHMDNVIKTLIKAYLAQEDLDLAIALSKICTSDAGFAPLYSDYNNKRKSEWTKIFSVIEKKLKACGRHDEALAWRQEHNL
jgi:hypothetical protein